MSDNVNRDALQGVGRAGGKGLREENPRKFPFEAFEIDTITDPENPVLSLKEPWTFEGIGASIPLGGSIDWNQGTLPPEGFAWRNGDELSRTTYADLWAIAEDNLGSDYGQFGVGDGSTTFNLPDDTLFDEDGWEKVFDDWTNTSNPVNTWGTGFFRFLMDASTSISNYYCSDLQLDDEDVDCYGTTSLDTDSSTTRMRVHYIASSKTFDVEYSPYYVKRIYKWNAELASGPKKIMKISAGVSDADKTALEARVLALENALAFSTPYEKGWSSTSTWTAGNTITITHGKNTDFKNLICIAVVRDPDDPGKEYDATNIAYWNSGYWGQRFNGIDGSSTTCELQINQESNLKLQK